MSVRAIRVSAIPFAIVALLGVSATPSLATSMPERTPAEVAAESALVVEATVLSARVERVGHRIVTLRELKVENVLRASLPAGAAPTTVTLVLPGGELDGLGQRVPGTPALRVGERYVLCLSGPVLHGARTLVGLWQGVWRVDRTGALQPFGHSGPSVLAVPRAAIVRELRGAP